MRTDLEKFVSLSSQKNPDAGMRHGVRAALAASFLAIFAAPALAEPAPLPPVANPPNQEQHTGRPIFAELVTPDLASAERFYGGLFGWNFQAVPGHKSPYAEILLNGASVGGVVERPLPQDAHRQSAWLSFLSVADAAGAAQAAQAGGGKILVPPHDVPGRGQEALLADPQGGVFGVLASSSGSPPDVLADPGQFIWQSLQTADPAKDAGFYKSVLGYRIFGATQSGMQHLLLVSETYARASINSLPPGTTGSGQWLPYVRVADANAAAAKAAALGGHILVPPRMDRHGGMIAVVADPVGAAIGLFDWPDDEKEVTP